MAQYASLTVGDERNAIVVKNLTRAQIVRYAGASGDFMPVHTDEVFATQVAGYPSVFGHGMLTMGMTGKVLTDWVGVEHLRRFSMRFISQVWPGDTLTATATVLEVVESPESRLVEFSVVTRNQTDVEVVRGSASAVIPR